MKSLIVALCLSMFIGSVAISAADTTKASDKASKTRGKSDSQDPNIKSFSEKNKVDAKLPAPPQKGGAAQRGVCEVRFDNRTQWKIQTFVDGEYQGLVGAYGDLYAYAISGATRLYARAEFDDGSSLTFGPRVIDCHGTFTWSLYPN